MTRVADPRGTGVPGADVPAAAVGAARVHAVDFLIADVSGEPNAERERSA